MRGETVEQPNSGTFRRKHMMHISEVRNQEGLREMTQDFGGVGGVPGMVVPYVTETGPRGERTMDIYSRVLRIA